MARLTPHDRATVALRWRCGETQRVIGADYGYSGRAAAVPVCQAISAFLAEYSPTDVVPPGQRDDYGCIRAIPVMRVHGADRRALVDAALREYISRGGPKPRVRVRSPA